MEYYRQQPQTQFFPGLPFLPSPTPQPSPRPRDLERRVAQLERQVARNSERIDRLNRRLRRLEGQYGWSSYGSDGF
ncbi:MAG: hypothetical protein LRY71_14105 [Bacillaceae bacterium]|nr:hypothetical protein [Bacillaceae bacterium]